MQCTQNLHYIFALITGQFKQQISNVHECDSFFYFYFYSIDNVDSIGTVYLILVYLILLKLRIRLCLFFFTQAERRVYTSMQLFFPI